MKMSEPSIDRRMRLRAAEATDSVEEFFHNAVAQGVLQQYLTITEDPYMEMGLELRLADVPNIIPELENMVLIINLPINEYAFRGGYYPPSGTEPGRIAINYGRAEGLRKLSADIRTAAMDETRLGRADALAKKFQVRAGRERPMIAYWIEFLDEKGAEVFRSVRQTFFHETIHHLDTRARLAAGTPIKQTKKPRKQSYAPRSYYNLSPEVVAHVQQALHAVDNELLHARTASDAERILGRTAAEFSQRKSRRWLNKDFINMLKPAYLTQLDGWLQEYWAEEMAKFPE